MLKDSGWLSDLATLRWKWTGPSTRQDDTALAETTIVMRALETVILYTRDPEKKPRRYRNRMA